MSRKLFLGFGLVPVLLAGCGGSGGGNTDNAQHAVIDVAKAAHSYRYLTAMARFHDTVLLSGPSEERVYDPVLGVDYNIVVDDNGAFRANLFEHGGPEGLGEVTISITDPVPYPIATRQMISVTLDGSQMLGEMDLTSQDEAGASSVLSGHYMLSNPTATAEFDLVTTDGVVSGTFDVKVDDDDEVDFSAITVTPTFVTHANFLAHGRPGTVTINADGSGQSVAADDSGTYTVRWTTDWNVTLYRPDGTFTNLGPISGL